MVVSGHICILAAYLLLTLSPSLHTIIMIFLPSHQRTADNAAWVVLSRLTLTRDPKLAMLALEIVRFDQ